MAHILILGGTAWLGRTIAAQALAAGHSVTALARGESGEFPEGAAAVVVDRDGANPYAAVAGREWDVVVELTWRPAHAGAAAAAVLARNWVFVSSCSVYADHSVPDAREDAALLAPLGAAAEYAPELYGEAKSGCEKLVMEARGGKALLVRPGLIGGPGDPSGRSTYWPLRLADPRQRVLVPDGDGPAYRQHVQIVDVRDLAAFILTAGLAGRADAVNAMGLAIPLVDALAAAREAAQTNNQLVQYPLSRMEDDAVAPWSGPRSLPLVLPMEPDYAGFARRSDALAVEWGLVRRPLAETFADIIADDEPWAGRQLASGLSAADEAALIRGLSG
ncbi:MAG: NAD-dependent epimerase/dehydratase family protein [Specibacter sp.]